jgi:DNA-binding SARP family transcriptional activator/predicted negative regulator of RcsB-dependent stress response
MTQTRILLLGPAALYFNGAPVILQRRVQRALLYYLASRGDLVGRDELLPLFWPDEDGSVARRRLTEALSKLRADLPDPDVLITNQSHVGLNFSRVEVDLLEFHRLLDQAGAAPWKLPASEPLPEALSSVLERAVRLWRSPAFMAGTSLPDSLPLEEWLTFTSQHLDIIRQRLLERLAAHERASGNAEGALRYYRQALESDELNEELHFQLLTLLQEQNRSTEAVAYCNYLVDLYRREENSLPVRLQALCDQLPARAPGHKHAPAIALPPALNLQVPFTGREAQQDALAAALQHAGVVLISGEAGAGKTRLIQETLAALEAAPPVVLARAHPLETALPYQALIHLLRRSMDVEAWRRVPVEAASALAALLPELLVSLNGLGQRAGQEPPVEIPEAVRMVLSTLAGSQPLAVVVENAQWTDRSTCQVMQYLLDQGLFDHNLLVIADRPETSNPSIDQLVAEAGQRACLPRIDLPPLDLPATATLIRYLANIEPGEAMIAAVNASTGGNPMVMVEVMRFIARIGGDAEATERLLQLPAEASASAIARWIIAQLSPGGLSMLHTICLLANEFDPALAEAAARLSPEQAAAALDELEKLRLIFPVGLHSRHVTGYYFMNQRAARAFLRLISPARQRLIHLRIAEAMENRMGFQSYNQAAVIAGHFEAAGEKASAFRWWLKAAEYAHQLFSHDETTHAIQRAEKLFQVANILLSDADVYQRFFIQGQIAHEAYDPARVESNYARMVRLSQQRNSPRLTGVALSGLARAAWMRNRLPEALRLTEQALPYLEATGDFLELASALLIRGSIYSRQNRHTEAIQSYQKSIEIAQDNTNPFLMQTRFNAHLHIAKALFLNGNPIGAREYGEQALREALAALIPYNQMHAYAILAEITAHLGDFETTQDYAARGLELAEQMNNAYHICGMRNELAKALINLGRIDQAVEHLRVSQPLSEKHRFPELTAYVYQLKGDIHLLLMDVEGAIGFYQKGRALTGDTGSYRSLEIRQRQCMAYVVRADLPAARALAEEVLADAHESHIEIAAIPARSTLAILAAMAGDRLEARRLVEQSLADSRACGYLSMINMLSSIKISLELAEGNLQSAYTLARALADEMRSRGQAWLTLSALQLIEAARAAGLDAPSAQGEIDELVAQLAQGIAIEPHRTLFEQAYRQLARKIGGH